MPISPGRGSLHWGSRAAQNAPTYVYQLDWPGRRTNREPDAQQVVDLLSESLLAFGRTGDPKHTALPTWPRYTAEERPTMIYELPARLAKDPRAAERKIFERK